MCLDENKWVWWSTERKRDVVPTLTSNINVTQAILSGNTAQPSRKTIDDQISRLFEDYDDDEDDGYRKSRYEVQETVEYANGQPLVQAKPIPFSRLTASKPTSATYQNRSPVIRNHYSPSPASQSYSPQPSVSLLTEYVSPQHSGNAPTAVRRQPSAAAAAVGILTGPIPSWEKPILHKNGDPTNFEHCKCSFSFNCRSPGIQFGNCDQGKTYCCYNEFNANKENTAQGNAFGSANIERNDYSPHVLISPGGSGKMMDRREVKLLLSTNLPKADVKD